MSRRKTKRYLSREERYRIVAERAVATDKSAHNFLVEAGILKQDGTLADFLR